MNGTMNETAFPLMMEHCVITANEYRRLVESNERVNILKCTFTRKAYDKSAFGGLSHEEIKVAELLDFCDLLMANQDYKEEREKAKKEYYAKIGVTKEGETNG